MYQRVRSPHLPGVLDIIDKYTKVGDRQAGVLAEPCDLGALGLDHDLHCLGLLGFQAADLLSALHIAESTSKGTNGLKGVEVHDSCPSTCIYIAKKCIHVCVRHVRCVWHGISNTKQLDPSLQRIVCMYPQVSA